MSNFPVKFTRLLPLLMVFALLVFTGCSVLPETQVSTTEEGEVTEEAQFALPKSLTDPREIVLSDQVRAAASARQDVLAFVVYDVAVDSVEFSKDGKLALVWIALVDKETGLVQPGEPGLVIAQQQEDSDEPWRLTFQADENFTEVLNEVPNKMLAAEVRELYLPAVQKEQKGASIFYGYRLPWPKGQTVRLTGSIGHVYTYKSCPSSCLYAFDFANGTMFDVVAAKQGTVKYAVWKYENGDPTNANYLVLEDTSTNPTTYQLYMHLAHDSIPAALRVKGAKVVQGQFLGKADDTGYSTGNHLHFHVHTSTDSYWGKSVDIVFEDVTVNGGRPRLCSEARDYPQFGDECMPQDKYVSQNGDSEPPTGGISSPVAGTEIKAPTVNISGWMKDDVGLLSGQLMYKTSNTKWQPIGAEILKDKKSFSTSIDLCEAGIPDGNFSLSIMVTDKAGNVSSGQGVTQLVKKYTCQPKPPVCTPAADEVALHSAIGFQGNCQLLNIGEYPDMDKLDQVKSEQALSIQVGAKVTALLYTENDFTGQMELFQDGDNNLDNNLIGPATASSIKVVKRILTPSPPTITLPETIDAETDLAVTWTTEEGVETKATLKGPAGYENALDWQSGGSWQVGVLAKGNYTLTVEAKNLVGIASTAQEFTVKTKVIPPETHMETLPQGSKSTAIKLTWGVDARARDVDHFDLQWREGNGDWVTWADSLDGSARDAIFWGSPDKLYEFRIRAVDKDGVAENFTDMPEASTFILPDCADDAYEGEGSGDDEQVGAPTLKVGETQTHNWCPLGDVDWVVFEAVTGDQLKLSADPGGTAAAAVLQLYDAGTGEMLLEAQPESLDSTTALNWTAPQEGIYAVRITPADERIAGEDAVYMFSAEKKATVKPLWVLLFSALISALMSLVYKVRGRMQAKKKSKGVGW